MQFGDTKDIIFITFNWFKILFASLKEIVESLEEKRISWLC